jgi:hypothetical protein
LKLIFLITNYFPSSYYPHFVKKYCGITDIFNDGDRLKPKIGICPTLIIGKNATANKQVGWYGIERSRDFLLASYREILAAVIETFVKYQLINAN